MSAAPDREARQAVRIGARVRSGQAWHDVVIRNVSARGMMGECADPPARGDYVELRCGGYVIVARVAWAQGCRFGVRAQERIALEDLIAAGEGRTALTADRRVQSRKEGAERRSATQEELAGASVRQGRALQFMALVIAGAALALALAGEAHEALARPLAAVSHALHPELG